MYSNHFRCVSDHDLNSGNSDQERKEPCSADPVEETIFSELMQIKDQLKVQLSSLSEREKAVSEREARMCKLEELAVQTHHDLSQCIEHEVHRQTEVFRTEIGHLREAVQQKANENQRLKSSFDTICLANKNLKQQLDDIRVQNKRLESQLSSIQGRLTNLQRKMQHSEKSKTITPQNQPASKTVCIQTRPSITPSTLASTTSTGDELMSVLMTGVSRGLWKQDGHPQSPVKKALQLISQMLPTICPSLEVPCVVFIHSLLQMATKHDKSQLTSTLRRIGEQIHQPTVSNELEVNTMFYKSDDLTVRTLSMLVILATLSQVDVVCEVLHRLKEDLKQIRQCRELFLSHHGVEQLVPLTQPINKVVVAMVTDIFLQVSMESALLPLFLKACSTDEWFSMMTSLLTQHSALELHTLEKLSILLQRLSKSKNCRHLFQRFRIPSLLERLLAVEGLQAQAPFLALNLQSTLLNLAGQPS